MIICEFEDGNKANLRHATAETIVFKDNKILLAKRSMKLIEGGKWNLPGGFADRDETMEQSAIREVYEETGWKISNIRLLKISDKPKRFEEDRQNITFIYIADALDKTGTPDWESDEIEWFALDQIPEESMVAFDHWQTIEYYKKYISGKIQLPQFAN